MDFTSFKKLALKPQANVRCLSSEFPGPVASPLSTLIALACAPTKLSPNTLYPRGQAWEPSAQMGSVRWMDGWKPKSKPFILQEGSGDRAMRAAVLKSFPEDRGGRGEREIAL